jgi:hypothetical protein
MKIFFFYTFPSNPLRVLLCVFVGRQSLDGHEHQSVNREGARPKVSEQGRACLERPGGVEGTK